MRPADLDAKVRVQMARLPQQAQQRQQAINALLKGRAAKGGPIDPGRP